MTPENGEFFRQLADHFPAALWVGDKDANVVLYVSPSWERLTGVPVSPGDSIDVANECIHPDDRERVLHQFENLPSGGLDCDYRIVRSNGAVRWVHALTFALGNDNGKTSRIAGLLFDITEHKERSLKAERLKDEFVATVSHELRTPLASTGGSLALLIGNAAGKLPAPAARLLKIAHANTQRLVRLINDVLDIEKIESGKVVFALKRLEIGSLIKEAIDANRGFAETYSVRLKFDPPPGKVELAADPDWLMQVVTNLLSNAIKYSPPGEEVLVTVEKLGAMVRISVRDHGPGIPEDFKPRVFQRFARADVSDSRQKGGTGLGLSIVKQIVTRLGGDVQFEDATGGGTVFYVDLPAWTPGHKPNLPLAEEKVQMPSAGDRPGMEREERILGRVSGERG